MSYQGWRRGSPYDRPGNQGGYNQRRGKPRTPMNQANDGNRQGMNSAQNARPSSQGPPSSFRSPNNSKTPGSPASVDKKMPPAPKTETRVDDDKNRTAQVSNGATVAVKEESEKTTPTTLSSPAPANEASKISSAVGKGSSPVVTKGSNSAPGKTSTSAPAKSTAPSQSKHEETIKKPLDTQDGKEPRPQTPKTSVKAEPKEESKTKPLNEKEQSKTGFQKPVDITRSGSPHDTGAGRGPDRQMQDRGRGRGRPNSYPNNPQQSRNQQPGGNVQGKRPYSDMEKESDDRQSQGDKDEKSEEEVPNRMIDINDLIRPGEKKFSSRCRLFVAGLPNGITDDEFCKLFQTYGETTEAYINKEKNFGFIRLDYKVNAEIARNKLDGSMLRGRRLQVRFASNASAVEVHGLGPFVTDDVLEQAFLKFGAIERATVVCDDRGKSKEYGIVEFSYKKSTQKAIQAVNQGLFVLGRDPKPVSLKLLVTVDEESGVKELDLERKPGYAEEREFSPRFIQPGSYEYDLAQKWKSVEETEKARKQEIENETRLAKEELENEIANAMHLREEDRMRQELLKKEEELRQLEELKQMEHMRLQEQLRRLEQKRLDEEQRRQEDLKRKQSEFHGPGDFRKMSDLSRQDDFRRSDLGQRRDDDRRRSGDLRRDDNRGRQDDNRGRSDDGRLGNQGGLRPNDMRRMDDKRKDGFHGDDPKLDLSRSRGQEDRGGAGALDGNIPVLQPPPPLPSLMAARANSDDRNKVFSGIGGSDFRNAGPGMGAPGNASNLGPQQMDNLRGFNPGQMNFPRGVDMGRQGFLPPGGPQGGFDSSPGRMPFPDQALVSGVLPGDLSKQPLAGGLMGNQPRLPPPPALPGALTRPIMEDQRNEGNFPRFEPRFGEKRKRIL